MTDAPAAGPSPASDRSASDRAAAARVAHLARLAGLELDAREAEVLGPELDGVLEAFRALAALDLGEEDERAPREVAPAEGKRLRADEPRPDPAPERLLAAAPEVRDGAFVVPRVVGGEAGAENGRGPER